MEINKDYWYKQGEQHGRADAKALKVNADPSLDEDNLRRIFAEDPDKVPAEWLESFRHGYQAGWWWT